MPPSLRATQCSTRHPNSGSSMKDSLNRIEVTLGEQGERVAAPEKRSGRLTWRR
jgi:hypothetical protein